MKIVNEIAMEEFYNKVLPELKPNETHFVALFARSKYAKEKCFQDESLEKKIITGNKNFRKFLKSIKEMEALIELKTDRKNQTIPKNCIVCYVKINPSSGLHAVQNFIKDMNDMLVSAIYDKSYLEFINKAVGNLKTKFQTSSGTRHYIDIDIDVSNMKHDNDIKIELKSFFKKLDDESIKYYIIETKNGYHVLLNKKTCKTNYNIFIEDLNSSLKYIDKTFVSIINKNETIPLVGTTQDDFEIKLLEKYEG